MNRFIFFLFFMTTPSSFCMDAPSGSIACAQETLPVAITESPHTFVQKGCILELVPQTAQETLKTYIFTGRGPGVAKMYAITADMRSLRLVSRANKEWIDSDAQLNHAIQDLARQYTNNNPVKLAVALGTKPAFEWLCKKKRSFVDDLTKEVINQLTLGQIGVARALIAVSKDEKFGPKPAEANLDYSVIGVDGNTVLNAAVRAKNQNIFEEVLPKSTAQLNIPNSRGLVPLLNAIHHGFTDRALKLLESGASALIYSGNNLIDSALLYAVAMNNIAIIKELLKDQLVCQQINFTTQYYTLPLAIAAQNNNYEAFKLLLGVPGVRINGVAIYWAIAQNQNMLADLLARNEIDFNQKCLSGWCEMGYPWFGLVAQTQKGQPLLDDNAARDRLSLIAPRIELNAQMEESGKTLLMIAIEQGKAKTIEKLLELGANLDVADVEGKTALDYAQNVTAHNKDRIIKMLQAAHRQREEAKTI